MVESPVSEARMRAMFGAVDGVLRENLEVGAYNQTIWPASPILALPARRT